MYAKWEKMYFLLKKINFAETETVGTHNIIERKGSGDGKLDNQKLEDQLNLALQTDEGIRMESENLNTGFDPRTNRWELIVKYSEDIERLAGDDIVIEPLIAGYAIVTIPQNLIAAFAKLEEIEFIEQPKKIFPQIVSALRSSCFLDVLAQPGQGGLGLSGNGILIAVIDSGIDISLPLFWDQAGHIKIEYLWDQGKRADPSLGQYPPQGFAVGTEYTSAQLEEARENPPSVDVTGHGTKVAAIAASGAPESRFLIVKLDTANQQSYPATTSLMRAFTYVVRKADQLGMPVAINVSYGNTYGPHDGTSLLERFLDNISEMGRNVICIGSGNEGASAGHFAGHFADRNRPGTGNIEGRAGTFAGRSMQADTQIVEFAVGNYERSLSLQLWKNFADRFQVTLVSPGGQRVIAGNREDSYVQDVVLEQTRVLIFNGQPQPYRTKQEIYFDFLPVAGYLNPGIWQVVLTPEEIVNGSFSLYMPSEVVRSNATRFLRPSPEATLTIPSTAQKVITVGAYQPGYGAYADFSGRGYVMDAGEIGEGLAKPDLAAPGVNITVPGRFGEETVSGTSYATPFVTAAAALLMEWGIQKENDPYLYGEKVKAYLIRGARRLPGFSAWPNALIGWGALCVRDSLPE